jgi:hypothetical protein
VQVAAVEVTDFDVIGTWTGVVALFAPVTCSTDQHDVFDPDANVIRIVPDPEKFVQVQTPIFVDELPPVAVDALLTQVPDRPVIVGVADPPETAHATYRTTIDPAVGVTDAVVAVVPAMALPEVSAVTEMATGYPPLSSSFGAASADVATPRPSRSSPR